MTTTTMTATLATVPHHEGDTLTAQESELLTLPHHWALHVGGKPSGGCSGGSRTRQEWWTCTHTHCLESLVTGVPPANQAIGGGMGVSASGMMPFDASPSNPPNCENSLRSCVGWCAV